MIHLHRWSKWKQVFVTDVLGRSYDQQERTCSRCGRIQRTPVGSK